MKILTLLIVIFILYALFILCRNVVFPFYSRWLTARAKRKFFKENPHIKPGKFIQNQDTEEKETAFSFKPRNKKLKY